MTIILSVNKIIELLIIIVILNKHKVSKIQDSVKFFEPVYSLFDLGNLLHCFILFCKEESNLKVGWLVNIVILDCDTDPPLAVCCLVIHRIAARKFLLHGFCSCQGVFDRIGFQ